MSFNYTIKQYPTAQPSKLLATEGGAHILNVELTTDAWNGAIIGVGDYAGFEYYEETVPTKFKAKIVDVLNNGDYLVDVLEVENAYFVYNPPVVEAEWTNNFKKASNFYLKAGVDMARAHELKLHDMIAFSADAFDTTNKAPEKGATISAVVGKKPQVDA